jgi:hypothetical protein
MSSSIDRSRRTFLFSAAAALFGSFLPRMPKQYENSHIAPDWDVVLNRVISDRNALVAGFASEVQSYEIGSPEWCMEEALAGQGLLEDGAQVHV